MAKLIQTILDGVSVGSLYALIALGYTMVYGVLSFINFAHGDIVMAGAWIALLIASSLGVAEGSHSLSGAALSLAGAMAAASVLGFTIERLAYRPLRNAPRLNVLITAIGVSLLIQNLGQLPGVFGTEPRSMPALLPLEPVAQIAGVQIQWVDIALVATSVLLMFTLDYIVFRTKLGLAMRAVAHDHRLASLMGVNVDRVVSVTFVLASALAAGGGFLFALKYGSLQQSADTSWVLLCLKAFVAAVVGGIGHVRGAMLGGLLIGQLEMFGASYQNPLYRDVYVFALLILVLLVRPNGLLGRKPLEKV